VPSAFARGGVQETVTRRAASGLRTVMENGPISAKRSPSDATNEIWSYSPISSLPGVPYTTPDGDSIAQAGRFVAENRRPPDAAPGEGEGDM